MAVLLHSIKMILACGFPLRQSNFLRNLSMPVHSPSVLLQDYGGEVSLATYMTLPLEQYFVLDPNQIKFIDGNCFLLTVPRQEVLFFDLNGNDLCF